MAHLTIPAAWHRAGAPYAPCVGWATVLRGPLLRRALRGLSAR